MSKKLGWGILVFAMLLVPVLAGAQEESAVADKTSSTVNEAGIPVGAFLFSPSLELIYENKDNIFLADKGDCVDDMMGKCSDSLYVVRPRLMLELPVAENYFRLVYIPQYRDYKNYPFNDNWSHFVDFQAVVDSPSGFQLKLADRLVRGVLETNEYDAGHEVAYGAEPFMKDGATLDIGYAITETDYLGAEINYNVVRFDNPTSLFYDYDTLEGGLAYRRNVGPLMNFFLGAGASRGNVDETQTDSFRNFTGWYGRGGIDGEIAANLSGKISLGYANQKFDKMTDGSRQEFSGLIADCRLTYGFAEGSSVELELSRSPYFSNFDTNAFYTADKIGLTLDMMLVGKLFGSLGGSWQQNDYDQASSAPWEGKKRSDDLTRLSVGLGYHFTDYLSLRANYRYEDRNSNIDWVDAAHPGNSYTANTFLVNLVVGY